MVRSAMMKKMTLRLLAVALTLMTAVAFMPAAADIVWAADTVASNPNAGEGTEETTPTFSTDKNSGYWRAEDTNGNKKKEFVVDISYGPVYIDGNTISYYDCTETGSDGKGNDYFIATQKKVDMSGITLDQWYNNNELVITGTTAGYTLYKDSTYSDGEDGTKYYFNKPENNETIKYSEESFGPHSVEIVGQTHQVTLEELYMSQKDSTKTYVPVYMWGSPAVAEITLCGNNEITGSNAAAIHVPVNASLTINALGTSASATGSLKAATNKRSSNNSAAIGGHGGSGSFGKITINSGSIEATGSGSGAGIGGSGTGTGEVTINGGNITATGGSADRSTANEGAPGIGCFSGAGSVTITDGNVTAKGGSSAGGATAGGIKSGKLSTNGNTIVMSSTHGVTAANQDDFNAIVWTDIDNTKKNATVYGHVLLANGTDTAYTSDKYPAEGVAYQQVNLGACNLEIPENASVTAYPIGTTYDFIGRTGDIQNSAKLSGAGELIGDFTGWDHGSDIHPVQIASLYDGYINAVPDAQGKGQHENIHVVGLDDETGEKAVYNGNHHDISELIEIDEYTTKTDGIEYKLDTDDWTMSVFKKGTTTPLDKDKEIIDAGLYSIEFSHKYEFHPNFVITNAEILAKDLSSDMVDMNSRYSYGDTIEYSLSDSATGETLKEGTNEDYTVTFYTYDLTGDSHTGTLGNTPVKINDPNKPLDVGTYAAVFKATRGNYTTERLEDKALIVPFIVEPASIKNADVTVAGSNAFVYNGEPQKIDKKYVTVTLKGKKLNSSYYDVTFKNDSVGSENTNSKAHITDAGTVTVTVIPAGEGLKNYTDYAVTSFEIARRAVKVESAVAAYSDDGKYVPRRQYDGTKLINITDATLKTSYSIFDDYGVIETDLGKVWINTKGLEDDPTDDLAGEVSSPDAGIYETATLTNVRLAGDRASNYTVVESTVTLSKPDGYTESFEGFEITRLPVATPKIEVTDKLSTGDKEKFLCTVKVTNAPNIGAMYLYGMTEKEGDVDNIKWQTSNEFDKLTSNTTYWFYCKVDDQSDQAKKNTYPDPQPAEIAYQKHTTPLIPQDPPEEFELEITLDPNGETYTVTIPIQEGAQYSFDGKNFNKGNVLKKVGPNETVTGYARFPATKTHAISEAVSATDVTPPLTVKTPVISPENGEFYGSVKVSISCATEGATIYYTTDGNYPVAGQDPVYKTPFTITEDTTVTALAVKDEMEDSEIASVNYVYTEYEPQTEAKVSSGIKITNDLKTSPTYNQKDSITAALSRAITEDGGGYTYQNIAYYDLNVKISFDNGVKFVNATADNFPEEGVEVTVPFPKNTGESSHDFRVAHMFSETSDRLGTTAGEIEKPDVTESAAGLTFTVNGCSPLAIGWVETGDENAAGADGENADDEGGNAADGEDADTLNANGEAANGENADGANGAGANANGGANADGTGADGENADGTDGSGAGGVVDELVNAVTTGDYTNPILWAAIALVSLLFIIIIVAVRRRA